MLKTKIKTLLLLLFFLFIGLQKLYPQDDDCVFIDMLLNELKEKNSTELYDYFDVNTEHKYNAWVYLLHVSPDVNRLDIEQLKRTEYNIYNTTLSKLEIYLKEFDVSSFNYRDWGIIDVEASLFKMLKNEPFEKIYNHFKWANINNKCPQEILISATLFKFYTNNEDNYYILNRALKNDTSEAHFLEIEKWLNMVLEKAPSSIGTYYRGTGITELENLLSLGEGSEVTYKSFISTTNLQNKAIEFAQSNAVSTGKYGAIIKIISKSVKSIKSFSDFNENEFLYKSKMKFIIEKIEEPKELSSVKDGSEKFYTITLKEI